MAKKNNRDTKGRIIEAAWSLFYRQGYDDTPPPWTPSRTVLTS